MSFDLHMMGENSSIKLQRCEYVSAGVEGGGVEGGGVDPAKSIKISKS